MGTHEALSAAAARLKPGESGLLALDWNNGNRTILVDQRLTGLLVGQTLYTTPAEIYRALVEATAFGALTIIHRFEEYGVKVEQIVNCGGIADKSPRYGIGLMSGSSCDGIDAALVRIKGTGENLALKLIAHSTFPYTPGLRTRLLSAQADAREICALDFLLGERFGEAARAMMDTAEMEDVRAQPALAAVRRQVHVNPRALVGKPLQQPCGEDMVGIAVERALLDVGHRAVERAVVILVHRESTDAFAGSDARLLRLCRQASLVAKMPL